MIRLLLALLVVLLAATPGHAAIAHVQTVGCASNSASSCTTAAITSTTGNLFVASVYWYSFSSTTYTSTSDNKSNTYASAIANTRGGGGDGVFRQDYKENGAGGSGHTFTATIGSALYVTLSVSEISGAATSGALDKTATGSDNLTTSHTTSSTSTTAQANEYLIGAGGSLDVNTFTCGGSFTERSNQPGTLSALGLLSCSKGVTATGTYAFDFTTDVNVDTGSGISTWKEAAAAGGVRQRCVGCGADGKVIE